MEMFNKFTLLFLWNFILKWVVSDSLNEILPTCDQCLENNGECLNSTEIVIKARSTYYVDLTKNNPKGTIAQISYLVTSTNEDKLNVQIENGNHYLIESQDSGVSCSTRTHFKFYEQNERLAIYCGNLRYECKVKYAVSSLDVKKERDEMDVPQCQECNKKDNGVCFESIALPVHSWYYLYYEGDKAGMYIDFLISSHKKDTMRIELQSSDGMFYLVGTRRDKVRCSDPQMSVPVRWPSARIAVYCYNNYIPCKFSIFIRSSPINSKNIISSNSNLKMNTMPQTETSTNAHIADPLNHNSIQYQATSNGGRKEDDVLVHWSDWSDWSKCVEYHDGSGRQYRSRKCIQNTIDLVDPNFVTHDKYEELLAHSNYPYCDGMSTEEKICVRDGISTFWENITIFVVVILIVTGIIYVTKNPDPHKQRYKIIKSSIEDLTNIRNFSPKSFRKSHNKKRPTENSPLMQNQNILGDEFY